jgi:hypothetical protein
MTESNCHPRITKPMFYHLTNRAKLGGDEWIRATNLLRMKELHYRCATSPIGSTGRDRTYDQLINSQLHYRCATVE